MTEKELNVGKCKLFLGTNLRVLLRSHLKSGGIGAHSRRPSLTRWPFNGGLIYDACFSGRKSRKTKNLRINLNLNSNGCVSMPLQTEATRKRNHSHHCSRAPCSESRDENCLSMYVVVFYFILREKKPIGNMRCANMFTYILKRYGGGANCNAEVGSAIETALWEKLRRKF